MTDKTVPEILTPTELSTQLNNRNVTQARLDAVFRRADGQNGQHANLTNTLTELQTELNSRLQAATIESSRVTLTSGAAAEGAYVQLIAATARKYNYLLVVIGNANAALPYYVDIATGGAGAEVNFINDIEFSVKSLVGQNEMAFLIKSEIAAGSRLSARVLATNNTDTVNISIYGLG